MKRYNPDIKVGLTDKEIEERISNGYVNYNTMPVTKSIKSIILGNTITLFNILNVILGIAVIFTGQYKNIMFLMVIVCNTTISTMQEIRSKKITDRLSLLSQAKVHVIRNGQKQDINKEELVVDDIVILKPGNQVVADSIVIEGECEVNESCITGESESVHKKIGSTILSGSYIVSSSVTVKVEHVGSQNYTAIITKDAKYIKDVNSELMNTLTTIIKVISIVVIPVGLLLFYKQYSLAGNSLNQAILNTVAALIGMIPDGLILLVSTVLAVSTVRLSQKNVLVQELFCIETLARVDTLCLDKTGTITEGHMEVEDIIPIDNSIAYIESILHKLTSSLDNDNATIDALVKRYGVDNRLKVKNIIPFSSLNKYSGIVDDKTYLLGAPSILVKDKKILSQVSELSKESRVIVLCETPDKVTKTLTSNIKPLAIILLKDKIKASAKKTLSYFRDEDVNVKIISGDSVVTVEEIAKKVGLSNLAAIDLYNVEDNKIPDLVEKYNVFARVTPSQKKLIIKSLESHNHTVAMIGDGVNDVLALKEADCSIAMASGSDAACNVSQLVLLDSNFEVIPNILLEGRRSINNVERSACLFLSKTMYSCILAIIFIIIDSNYPFEPIQFSLYNLISIGIPSVILALEPNNERIKKGKFLIRVLEKAIPTAISVVVCILLCMMMGKYLAYNQITISTISIIVLVVIGFRMLYKISVPFNTLRRSLFIFLMTLLVIILVLFKDIFDLISLNIKQLLVVIFISLIGVIIFNIVEKTFDYIEEKFKL